MHAQAYPFDVLNWRLTYLIVTARVFDACDLWFILILLLYSFGLYNF